MTTICYYVSDYGYGHATRSIAVIRRLIRDSKQRGGLKIVVRTGKVLPFIIKSLEDEINDQRVICSLFVHELGYVLQKGSIQIDMDRMKQEYERYVESFPRIIEEERMYLLEHHVDLVVSDISPIPFESAYLAGIPSVGISNFTWYTAYKQMLMESALIPLHSAYSKMNYFIGLAGAEEPDWCGNRTSQVGFYCRTADPSEVLRIRHKLNRDGINKIILFAIGMGITVDDLQKMSIWNEANIHFIVSSNMGITGRNISSIPAGYTESQNYVAAADLIITKPGWGTLSEGLSYNKPMLILERESFQEDANTMRAISGLEEVRFIQWEQLKKMQLTPSYVDFLKTEINEARKKEADSLETVVELLGKLIERSFNKLSK